MAQKPRNEARSQCQGQSDSKWDAPPPSQEESPPQIWDSYIKKYRRYALDTIILKTRSEVKVTVTQKWFVTLRHPKMHLHTKFGINISKNIGDMHQFLEARSEVKFKVTVTNYGMRHFVIPRCIHTLNLRFLPQII